MATDILTYSLKEITGQVISVDRFIAGNESPALYKKQAHRRDDHYLFVFQKKGVSKIIVDFKEIELTGCALLCILPGQVHYGVNASPETDAWLINLDCNFINETCKVIFEDHYFRYAPVALSDRPRLLLEDCIELLAATSAQHEQLHLMPQVMYSLIEAFTSMFASAYGKMAFDNALLQRSHSLTQHFKRLLLHRFKTLRSTADYARVLNITPAYLNDVIKEITGFTVSFWIKQTTIMEAKRLLYETHLSVKEIAGSLGFKDQAYFSRYFASGAGMSPLKFRNIPYIIHKTP